MTNATQIAEELGLTPRYVRHLLRKIFKDEHEPHQRWVWPRRMKRKIVTAIQAARHR